MPRLLGFFGTVQRAYPQGPWRKSTESQEVQGLFRVFSVSFRVFSGSSSEFQGLFRLFSVSFRVFSGSSSEFQGIFRVFSGCFSLCPSRYVLGTLPGFRHPPPSLWGCFLKSRVPAFSSFSDPKMLVSMCSYWRQIWRVVGRESGFNGGHLKPVTLKPVSRIFRIFRVSCPHFPHFPRFGSVESPQTLIFLG